MKKIKCKGTLVHNTRDTHGRLIRAEGLDYSRYIKNPVVIMWHEGRQVPVGAATKLDTTDGIVTIEFELDEDLLTPTAATAVRRGRMRALSSGLVIKPGGYMYDPRSGDEDITMAELTECSLVPFGRNKECLFEVVSEEDTDSNKEEPPAKEEEPKQE